MKTILNNPLKFADSYKGEHWAWSNQDIAFATGYLEPRVHNKHIQVAGISALVTKMATEYVITHEHINEFMEFARKHSGGFATINHEGWTRIVDKFNGSIPVEVRALKEGLVVPTRVPVLMVRNTVAGFAWVVPYFELLWLHLWKTMDVATNSFNQVKLLRKLGEDTMPKEDFDTWKMFALHDFGARSVGSMEEATVGIGHLQNSMGSDNWPATSLAKQVFGDDLFPSASVLALEHNVVLSHGEAEEHALFAEFAEYVLTNGRIGSMLIDTYDVDKALDWVIQNKDLLEQWAEEGNYEGRLVLRPDSGHPTDMPVNILEKLLDNFEYTEYNGYKMLPSWIGLIQGDGNNYNVIKTTCATLIRRKISLANIVFGEGGELINNYTRDDNAWAFKLSMLTDYSGKDIPCAKKPKDSPEKHSKEGYFAYDEETKTLSAADSWDNTPGYETAYYADGNRLTYSMAKLDSIRKRAEKFM